MSSMSDTNIGTQPSTSSKTSLQENLFRRLRKFTQEHQYIDNFDDWVKWTHTIHRLKDFTHIVQITKYFIDNVFIISDEFKVARTNQIFAAFGKSTQPSTSC